MIKLSRSLFFFLFAMLVGIPSVVLPQPSSQVCIYAFSEYRGTEMLLDHLNRKSDWIVIDYDLNNSTYLSEFVEIVQILIAEGVEVVPPEVCAPCLLYYYTWEEIYLKYASPLAVFIRDGRLTAIAIVTADYGVLDEALTVDINSGLKVFGRDRIYTLNGESLETLFERTSLGELLMDLPLDERTEMSIDTYRLLPLIIMAAAADAVNPCEFYVLIVFLSLVFFRVGRRAVLNAGIAFSIAIFIVYYLMGFGLVQLIAYVQEARLLIVIFGLSVGFRAVLNFVFGVFGLSLGLRDTIGTFLNRSFKRVPEFVSERLSAHLSRASESPMTAFVVGVIASSFLLPCTSGPYLIALGLIGNSETLLEGLFLLTAYNGIITIPFLGITLGIYMLKFKTTELKRWSSQKQRWFSLAAGLSMICLSLYLLYTIFSEGL